MPGEEDILENTYNGLHVVSWLRSRYDQSSRLSDLPVQSSRKVEVRTHRHCFVLD